MKHGIVQLTVVAMCLGLPSLAMSRPNDDNRDQHREGRDEPKRPNDPKGDSRGGPRGEPKGEPIHEAPPGARPIRPDERDNAARYEQSLKQEQEAARARRAATQKDEKRWEDERNVRAENHRRAIAQQWAHDAQKPAARAELSVHADRMARLNRALDLAEGTDTALASRINDLIRRENARHARTMATIQTGTP